MKRRKFIVQSTLGGLSLYSPSWINSFIDTDSIRLTILHTNDMHSRIDPFPMDGSRNEGLGGMARRSALINKIRKEKYNVLLLDSGDIFQGTPYFNQFDGELEIKLMSEMGYDLATIGNHDFDAGIDNLTKQMGHATFEMVNCNYDFSDTSFYNHVKPYKIFQYHELRVGVLGVGIELDGLVPIALYGNTQYNDPVLETNKTAQHLVEEEGCDYVICLSHLGYKYRSNRASDIILSQNTRNVDLILGGHTHTFMSEPDIQVNLDGKNVIIHQSGWAGILLGQLDIVFDRVSKKSQLNAQINVIE